MKRTLKILLFLFAVYVVISLFPIITHRRVVNSNLLPTGTIKGVYHFHSTYSDGSGDPGTISQTAADLGLNFAILTDHGRPNIQSSRATSWQNGVLLIGASELSTNAGHLTALGYRIPTYPFPPEPGEAIREIEEHGGISIISHPFEKKIPWTDWDISNFSGIEIISAPSAGRRAGILKLSFFPLRYLFNKNIALLTAIDYPEENMELWNRILLEQSCLGLYASDAHAKVELGKKLHIRFPSYRAMFSLFNIYIFNMKMPDPLEDNAQNAAQLVINRIKRGHFYSVIEAIAPANGFASYVISANGERIETGESTPLQIGTMVYELPFGFLTDIVLKRNGKVYHRINQNRNPRIEVALKHPGFYRSEISISENRFRSLPWIITNPVYLGVIHPDKQEDISYESRPLPGRGSPFSLEKNDTSDAVVSQQTDGQGDTVHHLNFDLKKPSDDPGDCWVALARRESIDLTGARGVVFETRASAPMRIWFELRTGTGRSETWYRHSFLSTQDWSKIHIPFAKFDPFHGREVPLSGGRVSALFITINNSSAYPGSKGQLSVKKIGVY